jgi:transposase
MQIEKALAARREDHKLERLQTIPGVSRIAAMTIMLELGVDVSELSSGRTLARWAGMCPGNNESAGKRKSGKAMHGDKYIKRILCEAANAAVRTDSVFKQKYGVIKVRLGRKKAIGRKILRVIYCLPTTGKPYQNHAVDYEEMFVRKNAPRWLKKLIEHKLIEPKAVLI